MAIQLFSEARPVAPQARQLADEFKNDLTPNRLVTYEAIEALIGEKYPQPRFSSVCAAAKKLVLKETGIEIQRRDGIGIVVLDGPTQLQKNKRCVGQSHRSMKRAVMSLGSIPDERLDAAQRSERDKAVVVFARMIDALSSERKVLRLTSGNPNGIPKAV